MAHIWHDILCACIVMKSTFLLKIISVKQHTCRYSKFDMDLSTSWSLVSYKILGRWTMPRYHQCIAIVCMHCADVGDNSNANDHGFSSRFVHSIKIEQCQRQVRARVVYVNQVNIMISTEPSIRWSCDIHGKKR